MVMLKLKRLYYGVKTKSKAYQHFLTAPLLAQSADYRRMEFLALDLETTSLDANKGEIVSLGFVPIVCGLIDIQQGFSTLIRNKKTVGMSATLHGISDREAATGATMEEVFPILLEALRGRVLLLHHGDLDMAFLQHSCRRLYGTPFLAQVVDTMLLEWQRLRRQNKVVQPQALRLYQCRQRYGLPDYPAHDAYADALATAELLLAQAAAMAGNDNLPLRGLCRV